MLNIIVFDSYVFLRSILSWLVCVGAMCTWSIVFIVVEISRDMQNDGQKIFIQKIFKVQSSSSRSIIGIFFLMLRMSLMVYISFKCMNHL